MLKMLKMQHPDKQYPANMGQKWTNEEEKTMLNELKNNIPINEIAHLHGRTIGGINARRNDVAYKLYSDGVSVSEIMTQTKLTHNEIMETITKRKTKTIKSHTPQTPLPLVTNETNEINEINEINFIDEINETINVIKSTHKPAKKTVSNETLQKDITTIKNDITDIKNTIHKILEMMKINSSNRND